MGLEDYFNKAREFLSTLHYPLKDPVTPLDEYLRGDLESTSENFAIHFISYLERVGVLFPGSEGYEINLVDLGGLEFELYEAYLKMMVESSAKHPLHKLLRESS